LKIPENLFTLGIKIIIIIIVIVIIGIENSTVQGKIINSYEEMPLERVVSSVQPQIKRDTCADVPLRNYTLTHSLTPVAAKSW